MRYLRFLVAIVIAFTLASCDDGTPIDGYGPNENNFLKADRLTIKIVDKDGVNLLCGRNWADKNFVGNDHIYTQLKSGEIYPISLYNLTNLGSHYWDFFEGMTLTEGYYDMPYFETDDEYWGPNVKLRASVMTFPSRQYDFDFVIAEKNLRFNVQIKYVSKCTEYVNCYYTVRYFLDGVEQETGNFTLVIQ